MPDITMCENESCPLAKACDRNEKSGTKPNKYLQSYSRFIYDKEGCEYFRSKE